MKSNVEKLTWILLVASLAVMLYNFTQISGVSGITGGVALDGDESVIPRGVPDIYGAELGVSFDGVSPNDPQMADATIRKLAVLDQNIVLDGQNLERYVNTLYNLEGGISCEYCCGAKAIIFENGNPACGCAHSFAMRGLAKYLITEYGGEYADAEILEEVGKWKTLFFPTQMTQKAKALQDNGVEFNYVNLASNKFRGIEQGVSGGMVGGC